MVQQGVKRWLVQGQGQSGLYPQAVTHLRARQKQALCTSCTSLMEIRVKIKLVKQSSTGMAVQRGEEYRWDTDSQLHRLCKVRPHQGCQKLCRLPQLSYGPSHGAQERPIPLLWICCLKPAETSVTHWGCEKLLQLLMCSSKFYSTVTSGLEETLLSDEDFLLLLLSVSTLTATD